MIEDLTLDLVDAEELRASQSSLRQTHLEDHNNEQNLGDRKQSSHPDILYDVKICAPDEDRVPSAEALTSMFTTFVGDDVTYSIDEIDMNHKSTTVPTTHISTAIQHTSKSSLQADATPSLSAILPDTKASSVDSGYSGTAAQSELQQIVPHESRNLPNSPSPVEQTETTDKQMTLPGELPFETNEDTLEFPWLFYGGLTSTATFIATYTNMSPILFVFMVAIVSFISFGVVVKYKPLNKKH